MRHYETTYILRPNLGEDQFTEIIERTNAIVTEDNGSIIDIDRWGIKTLAYEIKKETQGYYVNMNFAAHGTTVAEIERIFRIDDRLLRYLTIKLADAIDEAGIDTIIEQIAAQAAEAESVETEEAEGTDKVTTTEKTAPKETGSEETAANKTEEADKKPAETKQAEDTEKTAAEKTDSEETASVKTEEAEKQS